jgi:hypothetical protein
VGTGNGSYSFAIPLRKEKPDIGAGSTQYSCCASSRTIPLESDAKIPSHFSPAYRYARGEEARTLEEALTNEGLRRSLLEIADQYDALAEFAEAEELRPAAPEPAASR